MRGTIMELIARSGGSSDLLPCRQCFNVWRSWWRFGRMKCLLSFGHAAIGFKRAISLMNYPKFQTGLATFARGRQLQAWNNFPAPRRRVKLTLLGLRLSHCDSQTLRSRAETHVGAITENINFTESLQRCQLRDHLVIGIDAHRITKLILSGIRPTGNPG